MADTQEPETPKKSYKNWNFESNAYFTDPDLLLEIIKHPLTQTPNQFCIDFNPNNSIRSLYHAYKIKGIDHLQHKHPQKMLKLPKKEKKRVPMYLCEKTEQSVPSSFSMHASST